MLRCQAVFLDGERNWEVRMHAPAQVPAQHVRLVMMRACGATLLLVHVLCAAGATLMVQTGALQLSSLRSA